MHQMPLEYRILTALLIGDATFNELSLRLSQPRSAIEYRVYDWAKHKAVEAFGWGPKPRGGGVTPYRIRLTPTGRQWALDVVGGEA
jgi:hypothetical protein